MLIKVFSLAKHASDLVFAEHCGRPALGLVEHGVVLHLLEPEQEYGLAAFLKLFMKIGVNELEMCSGGSGVAELKHSWLVMSLLVTSHLLPQRHFSAVPVVQQRFHHRAEVLLGEHRTPRTHLFGR